VVEAHDWGPLHDTQIYATWPLLILLCPLSMLLDKSIKRLPLSSRNHLHRNSDRAEDVGKGGDLWHDRAGADDNLARAELQ
jgi:hypothetical protein